MKTILLSSMFVPVVFMILKRSTKDDTGLSRMFTPKRSKMCQIAMVNLVNQGHGGLKC